jgi:peptidoglycan/LPS O-acetylase OafA/YrhL
MLGFVRISGNTTIESHAEPPRTRGHIRGLDEIRGLAIIAVLVPHFTIDTGMEPVISLDRLYYRLAWYPAELGTL